jgi:hypothetical protein
MFSNKEIKLLILLRSRCHPTKINFEKLNKFNLNCSLKCDIIESQEHIFENCNQITKKMKSNSNVDLKSIFSTAQYQKEIVIQIMEKENIRKVLLDEINPEIRTKKIGKKKKKKTLPGGLARTQQNYYFVVN